MKVLFIILFICCSCTTLTWEQDFLNKGRQAQIEKDYYDSNFYFKEIAFNGKTHQQIATDKLLSFTYPKTLTRCKLIANDVDLSNEIFLKAKSSFIPLYNHKGSLDSHIALLKALSKDLDPNNKGINLITITQLTMN